MSLDQEDTIQSLLSWVDKTLDHDAILAQARILGGKYLAQWKEKRNDVINEIITTYIPSTPSADTPADTPKSKQLNATAFNDLYKWTMTPVIRSMEKAKTNASVTFGLDLRDTASQNIMNNPDFRTALAKGLTEFITRKFDRAAFNHCLQGPRKDLIDSDTINLICGAEGAPRQLADSFSYIERGKRDPSTYDTKDLSVRVYLYKANDSTNGWVVEATGPWVKVTWLETSMMQYVYETMLRHTLGNDPVKYIEWLNAALLRCATTVAFTHLIQSIQNKTTPGSYIKPALFTGRRTGGIAFILLQNLFFADHFKQFSPTGATPVSNSIFNDLIGQEHIFSCLGTSSCESSYILAQEGLPCLSLAGTHAHELSMFAQAAFPQLDVNNELFPMTQVLGHYLYNKLTWEKTRGPVPMLPDTLGTPAFLNAANYIKNDDNTPFLNKITAARQDSGDLGLFREYLIKAGYFERTPPPSMMASEIDNTEKLYEATTLGSLPSSITPYASFGAGGFFGDSVSAFDKGLSSLSMAVKIVRVVYEEKPATIEALRQSKSIQIDTGINFLPHIIIDETTTTTTVTGYPIKIGDISKEDDYSLSGKLSLDKNLTDVIRENIKKYAQLVRKYNVMKLLTPTSEPIPEVQTLISRVKPPISTVIELDSVVNTTIGGRHFRKTRKARHLKRKYTKKHKKLHNKKHTKKYNKRK